MMSIRAELKRNTLTTTLNTPCSDYGIDLALQNLGEDDVTKTMQFCSRIGGEIRELTVLQDRFIDIDELNFLAKYLDSFTDNQMNQFCAAMIVTKPTELEAMINLAFNLHNYTLITDFSDMAAVGKTHRLNVEMAIPVGDSYNYAKLGESLVASGTGTTTPYGVLFTNNLATEDVYNGQTFPQYLYEECAFGVTLEKDNIEEYLYLPCITTAIDRAVHRIGAKDLSECSIARLDSGRFDTDFIKKIMPRFDWGNIRELNEAAFVLMEMNPADIPKLIAVCDYADAETFTQIQRISENIDSFEFAPYIKDVGDLGKYLIRKSGYYRYDDELDDYYDYEGMGNDSCDAQGGQFTQYGYVGIRDDITIEEILGGDSDMTMGGM